MRPPTRLAVLVVFALMAAACGDDSDGAVSEEDPPAEESTTTSTTTTSTTTTAAPAAPGDETDDTEDEPMITVALPAHPWWENDVALAAPDRLDALAAEYVAEVGPDAEMERFLFGQMPLIVFDEIFAGADPESIPELLWLLHLSGYFGGRWLRGEIDAAEQEDALVLAISFPQSEDDFRSTMASAQERLGLLGGDAETVIEAARAALYDKPPPAEGEDPVRGLTDSFGYNVGYMLEILATPPEGIEASPQFQVTCGGLFNCEYASPKLAVLPELADLQAAINSPEPPVPELVAELLPIQDAAQPRGTAVWSGGLSVQGFPQGSYDQLLDVSSSFLEVVQATDLTIVGAIVEDDAAAAEKGLISEAAQIVWLTAYFAGITDGEGVIEVPAFVSS